MLGDDPAQAGGPLIDLPPAKMTFSSELGTL
jgi:hypothetical protein